MFKYLFFVSFLLIGKSVNAQVYQAMLDHPSEWHFTTCSNGCMTDIYFTDGDTLENGITYQVLNGYHYISRTFWLRENTSEQHVYMSYVDPIRGREEVLLYDYSLTVGDSIEMINPVSPFIFNGGYYLVDSIAFIILTGGVSHRVYYFSPTASNSGSESPVWIEGIGSLSIVNAPGGTPNINAVGSLSCHFDDGTLLYSKLDSITGCTAVYVTNVDENFENNITIYPSPFIDELKIDVSRPDLKMTIVNTQGQLLSKYTLNLNNSIDLSSLRSGVYFLNFENPGGNRIVRKIMKR